MFHFFADFVYVLRVSINVQESIGERGEWRTLPDFLRIASFALASFASSFALTARFAAIFSRSSASFSFFSSSVSGLTYNIARVL